MSLSLRSLFCLKQIVVINCDCVINMLQGWLTQICLLFCGRWIRGKCRWRIECVPWLWLTLLTTSGYRRPAKARRTGCSRWNNHICANNTQMEGKQRRCKLHRGPFLSSHLIMYIHPAVSWGLSDFAPLWFLPAQPLWPSQVPLTNTEP